MSDLRLLLIRHGEVSNSDHVVYGDLDGFHLSPLGVRQAHETATHLRREDIDAVICSPLARAKETATAVASHHDLDITADERLTESGQFPHWTGHTWGDIPQLFPGELESYLDNADAAGAHESLVEVGARVVSVIDELADRGALCIAIVSHQDPIQAARITLLGQDLAQLRVNPPGHADVVSMIRNHQLAWRETQRWSPSVSTG